MSKFILGVLMILSIETWYGRSEWQHSNRMIAQCMGDGNTIRECETRVNTPVFQYLELIYGRG